MCRSSHSAPPSTRRTRYSVPHRSERQPADSTPDRPRWHWPGCCIRHPRCSSSREHLRWTTLRRTWLPPTLPSTKRPSNSSPLREEFDGLLVEGKVGGSQVLLKVVQRRCSRDEEHLGRLMQQPGQCHLGRSGVES